MITVSGFGCNLDLGGNGSKPYAFNMKTLVLESDKGMSLLVLICTIIAGKYTMYVTYFLS